MDRITAEEVVRGFKEHNLVPNPSVYLLCYSRQACGLGAVLVGRVGIEKARQILQDPSFIGIAKALGITSEYEFGFSAGFGSWHVNPAWAEEVKQAYEDGQAARKAVYGEAI